MGSVFLVSILRNHRMVRMRHILFKHGGGKVSGEYLLIKRGRLELGNDQYDQQRSINLFHWCVLEISQFYLCFLTLIDRHFYMPPLFFFGVYAFNIQTEKYRFLFYDFKKKLTGVRVFPEYTTRLLTLR